MSRIRSRPRFSKINYHLAWYVFHFALFLSTSLSNAQEVEFFGDLYGPRFQNSSHYDSSTNVITEEKTSHVSAERKIDLIRYYLGAKVPGERVAVVVDTAETFYENIKRLWKMVMTGHRIDEDVMLFVYNGTDCSASPTLNNGNRTVTEILDGISTSTSISSVAWSILDCVNLAVKMIDSDGSIMLFTGRKPGNGMALGESTAIEMIKKRKEFNCIWCSEELGNLEEVNDYKEIARYTNGHFLQFTKVDQDEVAGEKVNPQSEYEKGNATKSSELSLEAHGILEGMKISEDETADLLYDPKISEYPEHGDTRSLDNFARIVTPEDNNERKEALELAALTAIESTTLLEKTAVEVTAASSLIGTPGSVNRLSFTVTNSYPVTIRHYFQARSTSFNIVYLEPRNAWIESGKSINVIADVLVPTTAGSSTVGTITLIIQSIGSVEKSAYIYVRATGSTISDTAKPVINYSFNSNCAGKLGSGTCSNNLWSVDINVQDSDSGLQRVTSSPNGIQASNSFISGTKSSTKFQYAATCCQTTVVITAEDLFGNASTQTIDVTVWYNLSQGEVAAIVVGSLLLLLILIAIVLVIICCVRRRRKSQDLPYTQRYGSRAPPRRAERTSF